MAVEIIEDRLKKYTPRSQKEELNALKEIFQEIALCALARAGFFKRAAFQGGSCLRIVHNLNRFSEDLDFMLRTQDEHFNWEPFLNALQQEFVLYSLELSVVDRSKANKAVKMAFLKDTSFGKVLVLRHPRTAADTNTITIKLEIDTNPPSYSGFETQQIMFPYLFSIVTQDLPSLFASKCLALLCRPYTKGRDWYDFLWYVSQKVVPNYAFLQSGLYQAGPWHNQEITASHTWLTEALETKIKEINWKDAQHDLDAFLSLRELETLELWSAEFFLDVVRKFAATT